MQISSSNLDESYLLFHAEYFRYFTCKVKNILNFYGIIALIKMITVIAFGIY